MYGGSYCPDDIQDLYVTPWDLGYGHLLKFDHDFIGRTALEAMATGPHGGKVTLLWNSDDVERVYASQFGRGPRYKQMEFPMMAIGWPHVDVVTDADGRFVGRSMYCGYSGNERIVLSLATLDADHLTPGTEVTVTWGEPGGGSRKPHVESHEQTQVRATVAPAPLATATREMKTLVV